VCQLLFRQSNVLCCTDSNRPGRSSAALQYSVLIIFQPGNVTRAMAHLVTCESRRDISAPSMRQLIEPGGSGLRFTAQRSFGQSQIFQLIRGAELEAPTNRASAFYGMHEQCRWPWARLGCRVSASHTRT